MSPPSNAQTLTDEAMKRIWILWILSRLPWEWRFSEGWLFHKNWLRDDSHELKARGCTQHGKYATIPAGSAWLLLSLSLCWEMLTVIVISPGRVWYTWIQILFFFAQCLKWYRGVFRALQQKLHQNKQVQYSPKTERSALSDERCCL